MLTFASAALLLFQGAAAEATPKSSRASRDTLAIALLERARAAWHRQDSALMSYDATVHRRLSVGASVGNVGRERLLLRSEQITHVLWHRDKGARIELIGARTIYPGASGDAANRNMRGSIPQTTPLPYYPGQERLWIESGLELDESKLMHPLSREAESYYTYESGDAVTLRLPDNTSIQLRELRVRPRASRWNVVVGSLWIDVERGLLVRAAYRLAEPIDIWARMADDSANAEQVPGVVRRLMRPMRAEVTSMVVEYGLHLGRFWLPRIQTVQGHAQATFVRAPFSIENRYQYAAVNPAALDTMTSVAVPSRAAPVANPCDTGATFTVTRLRTTASIPITATISCDHRALARAPELEGSIYSSNAALFELSARDELVAAALGLGAQPEWGLQRPRVDYGLELTRFNRVEGLSLGARATQGLGEGYAAEATARVGFADRIPNIELGLSRTNLGQTIRVNWYRRLAAANDWGNPLSFGSSLAALLWGRDEGFYYRQNGVELTGVRSSLAWRFFADRQSGASVETSFSLAHAMNGAEFPPNIVARNGTWGGASARLTRTFGLDPRAWRLLVDARAEAATGETSYGRASADVTLSHSVAALTLSSGASVGDLPPQRHWYLGGTRTIRGQSAGARSGDSYWLGRLELGHDALRVGRISVFGDAGWAGRGSSFGRERPISGAGVGFSILDGLVRLDVARGISPRTSWRADLTLESRF